MAALPPLTYRPEIDGLRAVAVIAVVLYHAAFVTSGIHVLPGGFIGVDVFFVISGYLIGSILLRDMNNGTFRFADFYERRARRILPALLTVLIATVPCAWAILLPKAMKEYAGSALCVLAFASNVCFWREDGYWAEPSALKPLLHTWSLSVEEQFYLFFPIALFALWKFANKHIVGILSLAMLASLQLADRGSDEFASAAFYLLPTRGWELLAGALLAKLELDRGRASHPLLSATLPGVGLFLIASAFVFFDGQTRHPSLVTLLPIAGTALLVWFCRKGEPVTDLLAKRPMVALGLISYGLYLWHFPIFAFGKVRSSTPSDGEKLEWIALATALAAATYFLVEKPFRDRYRVGTRSFVRAATAAGCLLLAVSGFFYGSPTVRTSDTPFTAVSDEQLLKNRNTYWETTSDRMVEAQDFHRESISVVVIGDSWGKDTANAIAYHPRFEVALEDYPHTCYLMTIPREDYHKKCDFDRSLSNGAYAAADVVVFADHAPSRSVDDERLMAELAKHVDTLRTGGFGGPIVVIGNRPLYSVVIPQLAFTTPLERINERATASLLVPLRELRREDERNARYFAARGLHYFSFLDTFCPHDSCKVVHDREILWMDGGGRFGNHLNLSGARYLSGDITTFLLGLVQQSPRHADTQSVPGDPARARGASDA